MRVGDRNETGRGVDGRVSTMNTADTASSQHGDPDHDGPSRTVDANLELMF